MGGGRLAILFLAAAAATAAGDVVHLKNGGKLEGVVTERGDAVEVKSATGTVAVPRDKVDHIEKKEYVPPARPKGNELPPAPELGERVRDPFLGIGIRIPYGWVVNQPSRGSVFTFYGPARQKYRAKIDVLAKAASGSTAAFLQTRRKEFEGTFAGIRLQDEAGFSAGGFAFQAFSGAFASEATDLHVYQAAADGDGSQVVLSLVCDAADREPARAEAARAFATFELGEPITRDRALIDRFRTEMEVAAEAYKKGDSEGAIAGYTRSAEVLPTHPMPWQNLGLIYASRNRMEEAIGAYRKVVELLPESVNVQASLASVYRTMGRYEDARIAYEKVLVLDPRHAEAYVNLSAIYQMKGDAGTAIRCAKTAIVIDPNHVAAHFNLGQMLNMQQKSEEAKAEYERVLEIDPDHKQAREELRRLEQEGPGAK